VQPSNNVKLSRLDHVNIQTSDLAETCVFFETIVGLTRGFRPDFPFPGAWFYLDDKAVVHVIAMTGDKAGAVAQSVYDVMFSDFDASVREMGAQDLGVGRRIKFMTEAMNGRFTAYETGLTQSQTELELALKRNLYGTIEPVEECLKRMSDYVRRADAELSALPIDQLMRGVLHFPALAPDRLDY